MNRKTDKDKMSKRIVIKEFEESMLPFVVEIWNEIVKSGNAFPQTELLTEKTGFEFFKSQTFTGVACDKLTEEICGIYILHPNYVGRCSHICNASYAVKSSFRGCHIGEALVRHSIETAKLKNFKILQFNAVVKSNTHALNLYKKLGFKQLGTIPKGFLSKSGEYEDIIPHYLELK